MANADLGFWAGLAQGTLAWDGGDGAAGWWWNLFTGHSALVDSARFDGALALLLRCSASGRPLSAAIPARDVELMDRTARGEPGKGIAIDRAISDGLVSRQLKAALRRVGLVSRSELLWCCRASDGLGPPSPLRAAAHRSGEWVVLVASLRPSDIEIPLTGSERAIVAALLEGQSNQTIARSRGTSPATVANQVARIFEKLGTGNRYELILRSRHWARAADPPNCLPVELVQRFVTKASAPATAGDSAPQ
jgi:DNA-binding NarL/FixJ family response regulator